MANATEVAVKVLDTENAENTAIVAFNLLNRTFFNSELPTPTMVITPIRDSDGNDIFSGYLRPGEHSGYPGHTIMINPLIVFRLVVQGVFDTWQIAILDTLLHEMIHYYNSLNGVVDCDEDGRHNEAFKDAATAHGLDCEHREGSGWPATIISISGWLVIDEERTAHETEVLDIEEHL